MKRKIGGFLLFLLLLAQPRRKKNEEEEEEEPPLVQPLKVILPIPLVVDAPSSSSVSSSFLSARCFWTRAVWKIEGGREEKSPPYRRDSALYK